MEIGDVGEPEHESIVAAVVENRRFILGCDHGGKRYRRRGFELRTAAKSGVASAPPSYCIRRQADVPDPPAIPCIREVQAAVSALDYGGIRILPDAILQHQNVPP